MLNDWSKIKQLGAGSFGEVWLVQNEQGRRGVLKMLPTELAEIRDRVSHELSSIAHPNLQRTLEVGSSYVVTEFIEGTSLADLLESRGTLPADDVRSLGIALAKGLEYLHQRAMVHRDIKPGNILVPKGNDFSGAVLIDFGLLGRRDFVANDRAVTVSGALLGSPAYMAPEQLEGRGLTQGADLWALGVVLYQAATGSLPFHGPTLPQMFYAVTGDAVILNSVPPSLRKAISWALEKDLSQRAPSAASFAAALAAGAESSEGAQSWSAREHGRSFIVLRVVAAGAVSLLLLVVLARYLPKPLRIGDNSLDDPASVAASTLIALILSISAGCGGGWFLYWLLERPSRAATRTRRRATQQEAVTQSIAVTVNQLAKRYRKDPHMQLMTQSLALVFEKYEAIQTSDPQAQLDLTLKALDAMMKLEARIAQMGAPWYQKYEKLAAIMTAIGTAFVTWWGLGQTVVHASEPSAKLFAGCPESPIPVGTRVRLEATGERAIVWSLAGNTLLIGRTLEWPRDASRVQPPPGAYAIWGELSERRQLCTIETRAAAASAGTAKAR
jgi:hypothetical protein